MSTLTMVMLVTRLAALAEAVTEPRSVQQRTAQTAAARRTAEQLHTAATEALSLAAARHDGDGATQALTRAAKTIEQDRLSEPPPWPWVFPYHHAKLAGYRALVAVRLTSPADALAAFTESLSAAQPAPSSAPSSCLR